MERESRIALLEKIVEEYNNTPDTEKSLTKLGKKYGIKRQTIAKYLKDNGLDVVNWQNRCRVRSDVFKVIDTEEKAYWLGFLYADGNISSTGHRIEVNLGLKDYEHLEKFRKFIQREEPVHIYPEANRGNGVCRLNVRCCEMWNDLNIKGCVPAKSLVLKWPFESVFADPSLIRHFVRGYCDGDGSIGLYPEKNTKKANVSFVGTQDFLAGVENFFGIKGYTRNKSYTNHDNKAYDLKYTGAKARQVIRMMYDDATIYLTRKYNIYKEICLWEEESSRRKSSKIGEPCDGNTEVKNG